MIEMFQMPLFHSSLYIVPFALLVGALGKHAAQDTDSGLGIHLSLGSPHHFPHEEAQQTRLLRGGQGNKRAGAGGGGWGKGRGGRRAAVCMWLDG